MMVDGLRVSWFRGLLTASLMVLCQVGVHGADQIIGTAEEFSQCYGKSLKVFKTGPEAPAWFLRKLEAYDASHPDSTALCYASAFGDLSLVNYLLTLEDMDVNVREEYGFTPLILASLYGHDRVVSRLLSAGAKINAKDENGLSALSLAVIQGHEKVVDVLLAAGKSTSEEAKASRWSFASLSKRMGLGQVKVNQKDKQGDTALCGAAARGRDVILEKLLAAGADLKTRNDDGMTVLMWAVGGNHLSTVRLLLKKGCDVNAQDEKGRTALRYTIHDSYVPMMKLLLDAGADVNVTDQTGNTPLMESVFQQQPKIFKLLLDAGADVNVQRQDGYTALMAASRMGNLAMLETLLKAGAERDFKDQRIGTALLVAAHYGHIECVDFLMSRGASVQVDARDDLTTMLSAYQAHVDLAGNFQTARFQLEKAGRAAEAGKPGFIASLLPAGESGASVSSGATAGRTFFSGAQSYDAKHCFMDSAQLLTEWFYLLYHTGDFGLIEKQMLSNVAIGRMPGDLKRIANQLLDICQQGRAVMATQEQIEDAQAISLYDKSIAFARVGTKLVSLHDPLGMLMSTAELLGETRRHQKEFDHKIAALLREWEGQLKQAMFELRRIITEQSDAYGIQPSQIIVFDTLKELNELLKRPTKSAIVFESFSKRYPYYIRNHYYAVKYGSRLWWPIFQKAIRTHNSILTKDTHRSQICAVVGYRIVSMLYLASSGMPLELRRFWLDTLKLATEYGLKDDGHNRGFFYFLRGVVNAQAVCYGLERMSRDDIWTDLSFGEAMDQGEYMLFQSLWCAGWLGYRMEKAQSGKLRSCLHAALRHWHPRVIMTHSPFPRNAVAKEVYREVLTGHYRWHVDWGMLSDDVVVTNRSPFALNRVECKLTLKRRDTGDVVRTVRVSFPRIEVGETVTAEGVMSVRRGSDKTLEGELSLSCEEMSIHALELKE